MVNGPEARGAAGDSFLLGDWTVCPSECAILRDGEEHHLFPQQMEVLVFLAENAGRVVSKEEILDAAWQGAAVQEVALARTISELRKVLGDDVAKPRYIKTIRKRGYKLIATVNRMGVESVDRSPTRALAARLVLAVVVAAVVIALGFKGMNLVDFGSRQAGSNSLGLESPPPNVAVLGFRQLSDGVHYKWLSGALHELLATELAFSSDLRIVPGSIVSDMSRELRLHADRVGLSENLERIQSQLGVDYLVTGTYLPMPEEAGTIRLELTLWSSDTSKPIVTITESGQERDVLKLVAVAGARLREALGRSEHERSKEAAFRDYLPKESGNLRLYYSGLRKLRELKPAEAAKLLQRSLAAEPDQPFARLALSEAWSALGYESKAVEEADRALQLAQGLPREQQLWVEARHFVAVKRWPEATERLRALTLFSPSNLEYGLRLARVQLEQGNPQATLAAVETVREQAAAAAADPRFELLAAEATAALGRYEEAHELVQMTIETARTQGAELIVAHARHLEAKVLHSIGKTPQAFATLEEAGLAFVSEGDRKNDASTQVTRAGWFQEGGDFPAAQEELERALSTFRDLGNRGGEAAALTRLGTLLAREGRFGRARSIFNRAIGIYQETGNRVGEAEALHGLGDVWGREGKPGLAQEPFEKALVLAREVGNEELAALMLLNLGKVHFLRGEVSLGLAKKQEAAAIFDRIGREFRSAQTQCFLGQAQLLAGNLDLAARAYDLAVEKAAAIQSDRIRACGLNGRGRVQLAQNDLVAARSSLNQALELRRKMHNTPGVVETRWYLAETLLADNRTRDATEAAVSILGAAREVRYFEAEVMDLLIRAYVRAGDYEKAGAVVSSLRDTAGAPDVMLEIEILEISHRARLGSTDRATSRLSEIATLAGERGHWVIQSKALFALGEVELLYGETERGERILEALEADARRRGWKLLAGEISLLVRERRSRGGVVL